jgi:hypothetical protein
MKLQSCFSVVVVVVLSSKGLLPLDATGTSESSSMKVNALGYLQDDE